MEKILSVEKEIDFDLFMTMNYQTFIDKIKKREKMLLEKQTEFIIERAKVKSTTQIIRNIDFSTYKVDEKSIIQASTEFINQLNETK